VLSTIRLLTAVRATTANGHTFMVATTPTVPLTGRRQQDRSGPCAEPGLLSGIHDEVGGLRRARQRILTPLGSERSSGHSRGN
jgi:hypothetical protein